MKYSLNKMSKPQFTKQVGKMLVLISFVTLHDSKQEGGSNCNIQKAQIQSMLILMSEVMAITESNY